jgi:hypothetical protein
LEAILEVTRALAAEPDLDRLLALLAAAASKVLQAERTSVWAADGDRQTLLTRVAEGAETLRIPWGAGLVGEVCRTGLPVNIPDVYADARFNRETDRQTGYRTRSMLCLPLFDFDGQTVVGALQALNKRNGGTFDDYDLELARTLGAQAGVILRQAAVRAEWAEAKRRQAELDLARKIQQGLLPGYVPIPGARNAAAPMTEPAAAARRAWGLDVAGASQPAVETGGDFFDYLLLPPAVPGGAQRLGIVIADVTGHGLGAALLSVAARACLRALAETETHPSNLIAAANRLLVHDLRDGTFLSLLLVVFDPSTGTLTYVSAGHPAPLLLRPKDNSFWAGDSTGPLLGILPDATFTARTPPAPETGDVVLLLTDGIPETTDAAGEALGEKRVRDLTLRAAKKNQARAADILDALLTETDAHLAGRPPADDRTAVVIRVETTFRPADSHK